MYDRTIRTTSSSVIGFEPDGGTATFSQRGCQWHATSLQWRAVTDSDEDFAAMFEASVKPRRFERGQTIDGTIVAIGAEVAFVNVGGKGEATIDIAN
jgi:hypothetical protein